MAEVNLQIGGRRYAVACRDGEEPHLERLGSIVAAKATEARGAVGDTSEVRQLLFSALLLADELQEARAGTGAAPDDQTGAALEKLAERMEALAARLEA